MVVAKEKTFNSMIYRCCSSSIFLLFSHSKSFCFSISFLETKQDKQSRI